MQPNGTITGTLGPPAKRLKLSTKNAPASSTRTALFAPYRTIGLICPTPTPFTSLPLGKETFQITTCIGTNLQTYDLKKGLQLLFITSPRTPGPITATCSWERRVLGAWHEARLTGVWVFQRGRKVGQLETPQDCSEPISSLHVLGSWIVGCAKSRIEVWKSETLEHYTTLFTAGCSGCICTMPTYLNKIFVGKEDGGVEIWNIKTAKIVYTVLPSSDYGAVTAIEPTTTLSLLAIAYESGAIIIQNIRTDEEVLAMNTDSESDCPTTSISFRTDGLGAGEDGRLDGLMATASNKTGDITFWDLNRGGRKSATLRAAHPPPSLKGDVSGGITKVEFLAGQSVLVSSGMDNALKTWIFDSVPFSPLPRILHSRGGHAAPISMLHFLSTNADGADSEGKWLLSASSDRSLWAWSLRRDNQNTELSQGQIRHKAKKYGLLNSGMVSTERGTSLEDLKAPKILYLASSLNRDGGMGTLPGVNNIWNNETGRKTGDDDTANATGWENIVTGHQNDKFARTWFWGRKRAGRWKFSTSDETNVTSVAMSPCGTFAFVGSAGGYIDMFNLQSGIHRQRFPTKLTAVQAKRLHTARVAAEEETLVKTSGFVRGEGKHASAVTGIVVDSVNKTVISCGGDGKVKFWNFATGLLLSELDWSLTSLSAIKFHRPSDLIALSCDDGSVRVVDITTKKLVRELWGAHGQILDFTFSNNGAWIVLISTDSTLRVFDLATGHLIEAIQFKNQPMAIGFSPTGEYLAVAQQNSLGVSMFTNRTLFTHVPTRKINPTDVIEIEAPLASGEGGENVLAASLTSDGIEEDLVDEPSTTLDQLSDSLLTLSLVPKARWQTLLNLEIIRTRNKPKEAPKKPQAAPFFLPSAEDSNDLVKAHAAETITTEDTTLSRISKLSDPQNVTTSTITKLLRDFPTSGDPAPTSTYLASLPASAADLAIRTLDPSSPYTEIVCFIDTLTARLRQRKDYELVQTWMAVFLRCHAELVVESEEVNNALKEWRRESLKEGQRVGELVGFVRGVMGWVGSVI